MERRGGARGSGAGVRRDVAPARQFGGPLRARNVGTRELEEVAPAGRDRSAGEDGDGQENQGGEKGEVRGLAGRGAAKELLKLPVRRRLGVL